MIRGSGVWRQSRSILSSLLRLRTQYQRVQGPGYARSVPVESPTAANPSALPGEVFSAEARRILRGELRAEDPISNQECSSSTYCIEVGKLLATGATFQGTTTDARIAEALQWVSQHINELNTTRRIMSIAMPLISLVDGKEAGLHYFHQTLLVPLEVSLQSVDAPTDWAEADGAEQLLQRRAAIVSVFQFINRILPTVFGSFSLASPTTPRSAESAGASSTKGEELLQMSAKLLQLATGALLQTQTVATAGVLDVPDGVHCLASFSCVKRELEDGEVGDDHPWKELVAALQLQAQTSCVSLLPLIQASVGQHAHARGCRAADVAQLAQNLLQLLPWEPSSVERILSAVMDLSSPTTANASVRDVCSLVQTVSRVRGQCPTVVTITTLRHLVATLRTKLAQLSENPSQLAQLRPMECSLLLSSMSRWESGDALTLPDDTIELLCAQFSARMAHATAHQLLPMLQGLGRLEANRQQRKTADNGSLRSTLPSVEVLLESGCRQATEWARTGALTDVGVAAQMLLAFSQLRFSGCDDFFVQVTPLLEGCTDGHVPLVLQSLESFLHFGLTPGLPEHDQLREVALRLCTKMRKQHLLGVEQQLHTPKDLVKLFQWFSSEDDSAVRPGEVADASYLSNFAEVFARQLQLLAGDCNGYELGALASAVAFFTSRDAMPQSVAQDCMRSLLSRWTVLAEGSSSPNTVEMANVVADIKRILDASRQVGYLAEVPPDVFNRLAETMEKDLSRWPIAKLIGMGRTLLSCVPDATLTCADDGFRLVSSFMRLVARNVRESAGAERSMRKPPQTRVEDEVLLLYLSSQLWESVNKLEHSGVELEGRHDSSVDAEATEEDLEQEPLLAEVKSGPNNTPRRGAMVAVQETFEKVGDALQSLLENRSTTRGKYGNSALMQPKQLVMLLQSYELVDVRHEGLMYAVLGELPLLAPLLEPLELSLLQNSFARLRIWNAQIVNVLASEMERRLPACGLRQLCDILRGMQRSGFLPQTTYLRPRRSRVAAGELSFAMNDWSTAASAMKAKSESDADWLEHLARQVVQRMDGLVLSRASLGEVLRANELETLLSAVRLLGYFERPPQPTFDTYYILAVKKLRMCRGDRVAAPSDSTVVAVGKRCIAGGQTLLKLIHHVRQRNHRRVCLRAIKDALHRCLPVDTATMSLLPAPLMADFVCLAHRAEQHYGVEVVKILANNNAIRSVLVELKTSKLTLDALRRVGQLAHAGLIGLHEAEELDQWFMGCQNNLTFLEAVMWCSIINDVVVAVADWQPDASLVQGPMVRHLPWLLTCVQDKISSEPRQLPAPQIATLLLSCSFAGTWSTATNDAAGPESTLAATLVHDLASRRLRLSLRAAVDVVLATVVASEGLTVMELDDGPMALACAVMYDALHFESRFNAPWVQVELLRLLQTLAGCVQKWPALGCSTSDTGDTPVGQLSWMESLPHIIRWIVLKADDKWRRPRSHSDTDFFMCPQTLETLSTLLPAARTPVQRQRLLMERRHLDHVVGKLLAAVSPG